MEFASFEDSGLAVGNQALKIDTDKMSISVSINGPGFKHASISVSGTQEQVFNTVQNWMSQMMTPTLVMGAKIPPPPGESVPFSTKCGDPNCDVCVNNAIASLPDEDDYPF